MIHTVDGKQLWNNNLTSLHTMYDFRMSEENADDMETTEADGELQIITEVYCAAFLPQRDWLVFRLAPPRKKIRFAWKDVLIKQPKIQQSHNLNF